MPGGAHLAQTMGASGHINASMPNGAHLTYTRGPPGDEAVVGGM